MIRVYRPVTEPRALGKQRRAGLEAAFKALNQHGATSKELKDTLGQYDGGKATLYRAQHRKCAYCERRTGFAASPLEHVRPKAVVWRHMPGVKPAIVEPGYWWLTWAWGNHLFACHPCNSGHKKNHFPLAPGSGVLSGPAAPYLKKRLRPAHLDASVEATLFIDPAVEDPLDHIEWRPVNRKQPKRLWKWYPVALTPKGEGSIKVLHLDELADDIGDHLRDHVLPDTEEVCSLVDGGQHAQSQAKWSAIEDELLKATSDHAGPTWNAIHYLVDLPRRTAAGLVIPPRP